MEHVDVCIVGAGLSGIGAACHLVRDLPDVAFVVLEGRERIGGTWDTFRYPGVRSDSDMFTLGYAFRPWTDDVTLADGPRIRDYVEATAAEYAVGDRIRLGHRVTGADWDPVAARWTVSTDRGELTCDVLWCCTGYYDHDRPHDPRLPGVADFAGRVVHPQAWPTDLDLTGQRVAVVGSGATAMTLVPALAPPQGAAGHVTMVQRTPSYVISLPGRDALAAALQRRLPVPVAYAANRWRNLLGQAGLYVAARAAPGLVRRLLRWSAGRRLPEGYDVDLDFGPPYAPWDQRLCVVPDGDLFRALSGGGADVVTGTIETVTPTGLRMTDGREVPADVIVTATGLRMLAFGGLALSLAGEPVRLGDHVAYQGVMLDGVPNFCFTVGYAHASWTLRADLVSGYAVRLLRERHRRGARTVTPRPAGSMPTRPILDLTSGYVRRAVDTFPRQGDRGPWRYSKTYLRDLWMLRHRPLRDDELEWG